MTELKVGDKAKITSRMSRNYQKVGTVVKVTDHSIRLKAAIDDKFYTMDGNCVDEVEFTFEKREWLSLEVENIVNLAEWCRNSVKTPDASPFSFDDIVKKNKEKEDRIKKDRAKANNGVTRQFGLKR